MHAMRKLCTHHLVVDEISKFCRWTRLGRGAVNLQQHDQQDQDGDNGHLEHVAHPPPPDPGPGAGLGHRGQTALGRQLGRGARGQNLTSRD